MIDMVNHMGINEGGYVTFVQLFVVERTAIKAKADFKIIRYNPDC